MFQSWQDDSEENRKKLENDLSACMETDESFIDESGSVADNDESLTAETCNEEENVEHTESYKQHMDTLDIGVDEVDGNMSDSPPIKKAKTFVRWPGQLSVLSDD